jgi:hypothetical protein
MCSVPEGPPDSTDLVLTRRQLEILWDLFFAPVTCESPEVQALLWELPDD